MINVSTSISIANSGTFTVIVIDSSEEPTSPTADDESTTPFQRLQEKFGIQDEEALAAVLAGKINPSKSDWWSALKDT